MRTIIGIVILCSLIPLTGFGQQVLGTSNLEEANSVLNLSDGTIVITGKARSSPESSLDIFLLHLSTEGEVLSGRMFGGEYQDEGLCLESTRDGGFVLAGYTYEKEGGFGRHDVYLLKFSSSIELEWERLYGKPFRDIPFSIQETDFGFVIGGYTKSQGLHGDYLLMAIDSLGNPLWDQFYEAPYVDFGHSVVATEKGYLIVGSTSGYHFPSQANHHYPESNVMVIKTDLKGNELERKFFGGERHEFAKSILADPRGEGWYVFGSKQQEDSGDFDYMLMKLDHNLNQIWEKTYGENGCDQGNSMVVYGNGFLLMGTVEVGGKYNMGLYEVDNNGEVIRINTLNSSVSTYGKDVEVIGLNKFVGIGYSVKSDFDHDVVIYWDQAQSVPLGD